MYIRPDRCPTGFTAPVALISPVTKAHDPFACMAHVIGHLALGLCGNRRQFALTCRLHAGIQHARVNRIEELPQYGLGKIAIRLFGKQAIAVKICSLLLRN